MIELMWSLSDLNRWRARISGERVFYDKKEYFEEGLRKLVLKTWRVGKIIEKIRGLSHNSGTKKSKKSNSLSI